MFKETRLQKAGGSSSVYLPKAMLERHRLDTGDRAFIVETKDGILITPYDPTFAQAMEIAETGAKQYQNALHELAR